MTQFEGTGFRDRIHIGFLILFFQLVVSICISDESACKVTLRLQDYKIVRYSCDSQIELNFFKNGLLVATSSSHNLAEITETVETPVSSDVFQVKILDEVLSSNGISPPNYHPPCTKLQFDKQGQILSFEAAGYASREYRQKRSICSLIDTSSPNLGYGFSPDEITLNREIAETGVFQNLGYKGKVSIFPSTIASDLIRIRYTVHPPDDSDVYSIDASGTLLISTRLGLIVSNDGSFEISIYATSGLRLIVHKTRVKIFLKLLSCD